LERAKHELEDQLNQLTVQLMTERKELRNLQLENVRLETELTEASQRLEDQAAEHSRNETHLQTEVNKLIDSLRDEKKRNSTLKRKGGSSTRELQDLKFQVTNQKSKLEELATENVELQHHNRKLQEMLKGEQKVNSSTMDCIKKELEYSTQELSIQRDQAMQQKAEFEKEIEKLLFDNREIKEQSRKTQRELSKELTNLTSELKDERDRIHELQKENRKLRQEVRFWQTTTFLQMKRSEYRTPDQADTAREFTWPHQARKCDRIRRSS
jgi:chromosome segregation ATPase